MKTFSLVLTILIVFTFSSCITKPKFKADERSYYEETTFDKDDVNAPVFDEIIGAEDMSDIYKYVKEINFDKIDIPTKEELNENLDRENELWNDLIDNTVYIRMPIGYNIDFNLKKFLSVEYIYSSFINGDQNVDWDVECDIVLDFLINKIYQKLNY